MATTSMAPTQDIDKTVSTPSGRPLQRVSWTEKTKNEHLWFKQNAEFYINLSNFTARGTSSTSQKDLLELYGVYNNQYPAKWFKHITDPLNAKDEKHRRFPAKVRPVSILRTNIDLLLGEFNRRPFIYQVTNMGEDGYNSFTEALQQKTVQNLTQHFVAMAQQQAQAQGAPVNQVPGLDQVELPEALKERFTSTYKDAQAIRGQKRLNRIVKEYKVHDEMWKMFKDWLIAGMTRSYKDISRGKLVYKRVSPLNLDYDKSPDLYDIEDGEWAVHRVLLTLSDVVDEFYDELGDPEYTDLENRTQFRTPTAFFEYLSGTNNLGSHPGKVPCFHVVWKGRKPVKFISYPDPVSGQIQEVEMDEDYVLNPEAGEKLIETRWVNEVYETWRIGDKIYTRMRPFPVQRNAMNNISECKLPYNGRNISDLHSVNISPLEIGLPFQIMYMIVNRTLELTIAKSKGKILLIDKNAIPRGNGWDDEKFFYYAEALGYGLMNRNQQGVDKTWNQYQVLDMSLFDQIKQLIELQEHFKQQWDDALGINRPRKGETYASDGKAVSQMGLMQSSVITDTIFTLFEQFSEKELQGLLDFSKFLNADGLRSIYNSDDYDTEMANEADVDDYSSAELGVLVSSSTQEQNALDTMKAQFQAMIQNGAKPSTVLEMIRATNIAELSQKLKKIEDIEAQMQQQEQQSEQEAQQAADERKERFAEYQNMLDMQKIDKEWDRKDQNTMIKGEYDVAASADMKAGAGAGEPDIDAIEKRILAKQKLFIEEERKRDELRQQERQHLRDDQTKRAEIKSREKVAAEKAKTDRMKVRASKAKSK